MPALTLQGVSIHYLAEGATGAPVILLHGGGSDSAELSWSGVITAFADRHRVYAPDWPGYGRSGDAGAPHSIDYYVSILHSFMDALGLAQASLVGISMGGSVAMGFALRYPERVDRLALVDSYGLASRAPAHWLSWLFVLMPGVNALTWAFMRRSRAMARWSLSSIFHDPGKMSEELVDMVFADVQNKRAGKAFEEFQKHEVLRDGLRTVYMGRLGEISAPTLIVHGEQDRLVPLAAAQEAAQRIPNAQLHVIKACGHWPQREKPQEFTAVVKGFLTG